MNTYRTFVASGSLLLGMPLLHGAITPLQTGNFDFQFDSDTYAADSGPQSLYSEVTLNGFTKFDPALGTLTKVLVSLEVEAGIFVDLFTDDIIDDQQLFSLEWDSSNSLFQTSVAYKPTGSGIGLGVTFDLPSVPTLGGVDLDPADYSGGELPGFSFSDSYGESYGAVGSGSGIPSTGEILASDPAFNLNDFQGVGSVEGLVLAMFADIDTAVFSDNIGSASLGVYMDVDNFGGKAQLQYEYTPVPEPRLMAGLLGLAALAAAAFRRRRLTIRP
jgi:MYXO-CTERM domain-containing protein